jgi:hypothetical protein
MNPRCLLNFLWLCTCIDSPSQLSNIASSGSDLKLDRPPGFSLKNGRINGCDIADMVLGTPNSNPACCAAPIDSPLSRCFVCDSNKNTFRLSGQCSSDWFDLYLINH